MAVLCMCCSNECESVNAVTTFFAYANQDSACKWNGKFACFAQCVDAALRFLVWRTAMTFQIVTQRFKHHALRRGDASQHCQLIVVQRTCICMWQQAGFVEHKFCHVMQVVHGGVVSIVAQPVGCNFITFFRAFAKSEQCFLATSTCALTSDSKNIFCCHVWLF